MARAIAAGRVPWGNMWEYSSLLALLVVVAYLVIVEGATRSGPSGRSRSSSRCSRWRSRLSVLYVEPGPLVPALNSYWLKIHVFAAIVGSSLFALGGGVLTVLYLYQAPARAAAGAALGAGTARRSWAASQDLAAPRDFVAGADEPVGEIWIPRRAPPRRAAPSGRAWTAWPTARSRSASRSGRSR